MKNTSEQAGKAASEEKKIGTAWAERSLTRLLRALILPAIAALTLPAAAQAQLSLTLGNNVANAVTQTNYGRQVSFSMILFATNGPSEDTQIVVTVPTGVTFLSASSGISAVSNRTQIILGLGEVQGAFLNNFLTLSIASTIGDGTPLQASFQASGHLTGSAQIVSSNVVTGAFQAGYLPVGVYLQTGDVSCTAVATNSDSTARLSSSNGINGQAGAGATSTFNASSGGMAAVAEGQAGGAPATLSEVGQIANALSLVTVPDAIGGGGGAMGGFSLFACPPVICGIALPARVNCGAAARFSFSNPNPYPVPLIVDERIDIYSAAGNEAATDPITGAKFGYPGSANIGGDHPAQSGGGIETHKVSERLLYTPSGDTESVHEEIGCFGGIPQNTTAFQLCNNPPGDTTVSIGNGPSPRQNSSVNQLWHAGRPMACDRRDHFLLGQRFGLWLGERRGPELFGEHQRTGGHRDVQRTNRDAFGLRRGGKLRDRRSH